MDKIEEEIYEMFDGLVCGYDEIPAQLAQILVPSDSSYSFNGSSGLRGHTGATVKIRNEKTEKSYRFQSFYNGSGNIDCAIQMLKAGYGIRETARFVGMNKNTVMRVAKNLFNLKCRCGENHGHKGWCKERYKISDKRKEFMKTFGRKI